MLGFVGNALQCQIAGPEGDTCASVTQSSAAIGFMSERGWIWAGIIGIVALSALRAVSMYAMTLLNNTGVQRGLVSIQSVQFDSLTDGDFARITSDTIGKFRVALHQ